jgi:pimeloyl-ACP methyl ester carboxylesterase
MTRFVTAADGARIAYEVAGSGPPLLFLHCLPGSREYWRECGYVDALSGRFTVVTMDTRGFGESDAPNDLASYAEERVLGDTLAVMNAVSADLFTLWGHSYGATIARQLGAISDRVTRVIMAGGHFGVVFDERRVAEARAGLEPLAQAQGAPDPVAALDALGVPREERDEALRFPTRTALLTIESLASWRPFMPSDLRCPALIITGTRDIRVLAALNAQREAISAAGVKVVTLPDVDHDQLVTAPDVVLPVALQFLDDKTSS